MLPLERSPTRRSISPMQQYSVSGTTKPIKNHMVRGESGDCIMTLRYRNIQNELYCLRVALNSANYGAAISHCDRVATLPEYENLATNLKEYLQQHINLNNQGTIGRYIYELKQLESSAPTNLELLSDPLNRTLSIREN